MDPARPIEHVTTTIIGILEDMRVTGGNALTSETALLDGLGLDSLAIVTLLEEVRCEFGVDVAGLDLSLSSIDTLGDLSHFVAAHLTP